MRYALLTGGVGFIASYISRQLIMEGHVNRIVALDHYGRYTDSTRPSFVDYRRKRIEDFADKLTIERGEAKYYSVMNTIIDKYRPEYIFHLAALPLAKIDNINTQEGLEGSVESTSNILEIIGQMKKKDGYCPKRFIYTSSSMVYGDFISDAATEDHPTNPKELYGTMKLAGEILTRGLGNFYEIPTVIIRPTAVYGPTDMNRRVSQIFVEKAIAGEKLKVYGREEALDFTYVKDVAAGFILCATHPNAVNQTFNIAHGKAHTLMDYVLCLQRYFPDLEYDIVEREAFRPKRGTLSIEKARSRIGFEPRYSLEQGIAEYLEFMLQYHQNGSANLAPTIAIMEAN
jgi:nucleoside-diphosphate-sugar epimerase